MHGQNHFKLLFKLSLSKSISRNVIRRKWCCLGAWNTEVLHASNTAITNIEILHNKEVSSSTNSGQPVR